MNLNIERPRKLKSGGFALIEAMVSFVILAVGLVALLSFHGESQRNVSEAKTEAEATTLAEAKLHELESFLSEADTRLDDGTSTDTVTGVLASFNRSWTVVTDASDDTQKRATVTVSWNDRNDKPQTVILSSDIYFHDPGEEGQDFIVALNEVRENSGSEYVWGPGTGTSTGTGTDSSGGNSGASGDSGNGTGSGGTDNGSSDSDNVTVIISGTVTVSGSGTQFSGVSASSSNYTMTCNTNETSISGTYSYSCEALVARSVGLDVRLTFSTNKVVCETYSNDYQDFTGLTASTTFNVNIRKNTGDCGSLLNSN